MVRELNARAAPAVRVWQRAWQRTRPMTAFVLRRLAHAALTLFATATLIFAATSLLPGNIAATILGQSATPSAVQSLEHELALDRPLAQRYGDWLGALLHGDAGKSFTTRTPVMQSVLPRLANTLLLAGAAAAIALPLALAAGIAAALNPGSLVDRVVLTLMRVSVALPEFFTGYLLILLFAVAHAWLPSSAANFGADGSARDNLAALALPCATLALAVIGHMASMIRAALIDVLAQPYIEMARLKGLGAARIVWRHALPCAIAPIANIVALNLAWLTVGAVVVETIFVWPGLGQYMVDSVSKRDIPAVQACGVVFAAIYTGLNLAADLVAMLFDPRLRPTR
ncbi:Peptide/nickel transport system permease protein [Paraburkholderia tropica]|uniref:ABC transporter permease n=1 Tax=Paraburkholderia tropica TaxID=92647 RepID=UPI001CB274DE|nr:ABC transporter permease [Paraburkholderia tropica]CAG9202246.1 Peptide/nickel transport system permease protein [Paraburkholderia tropica]